MNRLQNTTCIKPFTIAAVAAILFSSATSGVAGMFTGSFAPENWELSSSSINPGSFVFSGLNNAEVLTITSANADGLSDTIVQLMAPYPSASGRVDFTWTLAQNGNLGAPQAYFYVGGVQYALVGSSGSLTGLWIGAGDAVSFELVGEVEKGKSPAQLEIGGWDFSSVPEPGPLATGVLTFVAASLLVWRQSRGASAAPPSE